MKNRYLIGVAFLAIMILGAWSCFQTAQGTPVQKAVTADEQTLNRNRADSLLKLMTLAEKLGQLQQLDGGISKNELPKLIEQGKVGSVLNEVDPERVTMYQKIALEKSRLGIPLLIGRDVIHGYRTVFPIPLAQSASWNLDLVEEGSRISAVEASAKGVNWTFAPMIDITRDPRWGRVAESPGEDTHLTCEMGSAMIRGLQGNGNYQDGNIAACAKHFAAYGITVGGRDYTGANMGERQLRDVYLRPFKAAVDSDAMSFMSGFNEVNDIPASGSEWLLKEVLREEWEYQGMLLSDWTSITEMIDHGYCKDKKEAAFKAMRAGVDMEMVSTSYNEYLEELIKEGKIDIKQVDTAVRRILIMKFRLGLFENPYPVLSNDKTILSKEHLEAAKQAAIESAVLIKNDKNALPLSDKINSVAVIGPMADAPHDQLGTWSFDGKKADSQTYLNAIRNDFPENVTVNYAPGLKISRTIKKDGFNEAINAAKKSDVILFFAGEEAILSGEAHCRAHLDLPGAQEELLDELVKTGKPIVMIVVAGRPLVLTDLLPKVDALLYAWQGGTMAGPAISDLLLGKANPSGKLPITFLRAVGQIPMFHSHKNTGRPANENEWTQMYEIPEEAWQTSLGNRSHYLDEGYVPLFPFGYGLSYTNFKYGKIKIDKNKITPTDTFTAQVEVTNTGKTEGKEVVQMYIRDLFGSVTRPVKELKGFQKISLKPGETKTVKFEVSRETLNFWNADMDFTVEPGKFKLWIGGHSATKEFVEFEII